MVFFGPSFSGKSTLIRIFVHAAAASPEQDAIVLTPAAASAAIVSGESVPYLIRVDDPGVGPPGKFVICDSDGRTAEELLARPDVFDRRASGGALATAVRAADALVLVVAADASPQAVGQTFESFRQFLGGLERGRTFGRVVGGLPVFLTLTKCDELHSSGDAPTDWLARVDVRKDEIRKRFVVDFGDELVTEAEPDEEPTDDPFLPFGSIDLHVAATATRVPDGPAFAAHSDPGGTFGVADLVRDSLTAGRAYRDRATGAARRLKWTVRGAGAVLATMLIGLTGLVAASGFAGDPLADRVRAYEASEPPPAVRLSDAQYARFRHELQAVRVNPRFDALPTDLKDFVTTRLSEFDAYKEYRGRFRPPRLGPAEVRSTEQADRLAADLTTALAPPPEYAEAWAETDAVRLWWKWQADLVLVREAAGRLQDWYSGLIRRANQLLLTDKPPDPAWRAEVGGLFKSAVAPPFAPTAEIEQSLAVPIVRGRKLTYAPAFAADRVVRSATDWADARDRLTHLRDLADALGLIAGPGAPFAVLELPEPTPDGNGSRELAAARLAALRVAFPPPAYPGDDYPEWVTDAFPDPVRKLLDTRLAGTFDVGARHARVVVAQLLNGAEDRTRAADQIARDDGLKAWSRLLGLLRKWTAPPATPVVDPVRELVEFLKRDRFDLDLRSVVVTLPDDLLEQRPEPRGSFVVTHTPAGGAPREYKFRVEGDGRREHAATAFTFVPDGPSAAIPYRSGDGLTAALGLRAGGREYRLVWSGGRSAVYQFDRLWAPPKVEKVGPLPVPEPAPGVRLVVPPPGTLPAIPALLPDSAASGR
ncbi:hypothetical protein FRUB_04800 [Fimbriiglobus ruber]|uniref:IcmF-related protein n=1 Tax=Fimbriiglobus ruber TaxID=1908690 RepID=A0A225DQN0_9BACT|nr:hypothetical protein FRUB_04800 [Fimbriiglobus ruber]